MAIYLPNSNSLILLIPKCGSTWMRHILEINRIFHVNLGPEELRGHGKLALFGRDFDRICAVVRNPIDWHHSYWSYRSRGGSAWDSNWSLDSDCQSSDFQEYVNLVTTLHPGFLTKMFEGFTGSVENPIDFIGKIESIREDFQEFLTLCGEHFDKKTFENVSSMNESPKSENIDKKLKSKIFHSEIHCFKRYGYCLQ